MATSHVDACFFCMKRSSTYLHDFLISMCEHHIAVYIACTSGTHTREMHPTTLKTTQRLNLNPSTKKQWNLKTLNHEATEAESETTEHWKLGPRIYLRRGSCCDRHRHRQRHQRQGHQQQKGGPGRPWPLPCGRTARGRWRGWGRHDRARGCWGLSFSKRGEKARRERVREGDDGKM